MLCDAMVRAVAGWSAMEQSHGLLENVIRALETDLKACRVLGKTGFEQREG